jgi:hypothetical protein
MAAELANTRFSKFYKSTIITQDGDELYDILCYDDLILGKPMSERNKYPFPQKQPKTRKEQHVLMRYSADAEPQTLWQGEIINFEEGYNLEIFPHPTIQGDYLIFTHPESNMAASRCYWLTNQEEAPTKCIEIIAAQTELFGLKYIHYHAGRFFGVFHQNNTTRIHIGKRHHIYVCEITIRAYGARRQIVFNGKQIPIVVESIRPRPDGQSQSNSPTVISRFCSSKLDNLLVFKSGNGAEYHYNIDTCEISKVNEYNFIYLQPDGRELEGWDGDIPPNPIYYLKIYTIPESNDLLIQDTLFDNLYIHKALDNRFHHIDLSNFAGLSHRELIIDVRFLNSKFVIISTSCGKIILAQLDTENSTLTKMYMLTYSIHIDSVYVATTGAIIMNDAVYEPIVRTYHAPFADRCIARVSAELIGITPGMANLVGKWVVALKSTNLGS